MSLALGDWRALILRDFALAEATPYETEFDLIHVHYGVLGVRIATLIEAGLLRGRLVVSFHGHDATRPASPRKRRRFQWMFERASLVSAPTRFLSELVEGLGCPTEKLVVVPSGVDLTRFCHRERQARPDGLVRLLSVGRLVEQKGHAVAFEALARVVERRPDVRYAIVGEGPERARLEALIERLGLQEHVQLLGRRTHDEVLALMSEAHVFLQPSIHIRAGNREVLGVAALEAQACGLPVLASDVGGLPEAVPPEALVPTGDAGALAERLAALLAEPSAWRELGRAGRSWVERRFDQRVIVSRWLDLYREVLRGDRVAAREPPR